MATKFLWLTDIHLNFLDPRSLERFIAKLVKKKPDGVIISGDIGEADSVVGYLKTLHDFLDCDIYFVLGNHDYYHGRIGYLRKEIADFVSRWPRLKWLNISDVISLTENTGIIGHDSWADARFGDYQRSTVLLNDFLLISEFVGKKKEEQKKCMEELAQQAALHFQTTLPKALQNHKKVIIATHVPPFKESSRYKGKISSPDWLPFFSCKVVGEVLFSIMADFPEKEALVLCGHTHGKAVYQPLSNLTVLTGAAIYGKPGVSKVIEID